MSEENEIGNAVLKAAFDIHRELGPGLLESVYAAILADELAREGFSVQREVPIPIVFRGRAFDEGFRADLIIAEKVIVELKSVERATDAHKKQVLTYLKLTGLKLGYLINFGEAFLRNGITRVVNGLENDPLRASAPQREK